MTAITTLRATIAAALVDDTKWQTFSFPPATLLANSVVIAPDDPYLSPQNNSQNSVAPLARFKILITVPMFDNQGNLSGIEDTIVGVFNKLAASSLIFNIGDVSAPAPFSGGSGELLTAEMSISILTTWS